MIDDKELATKLKSEFKKFNLTRDQRISIAILIKRNIQYLEKCLEFLKNADPTISGEEIIAKIINICY